MSLLNTFKKRRILNKVISLLIAQAFIISSISFAIPTTDQTKLPATSELTTNPDKIVIPRESGLVKTKYTGNNKKLIIHIQDAHCNYEAQSNIVKILESLVKNYNMSLVSVEGADGNIDTSWFRAFPDEEVRKEVADYFMKKGEITGPEFLSITSNLPIKLFGAETRSYYVQNLNAFMSSYPSKDETEKYYNHIKTALNRLKGFIYSDELKTMDTKAQEYESKKMQFNDYIRFLQVMAEKQKVNLRGYDNLFKLTSVLLYEKKIDFNVTDKERSALIDELSKTLSKDALTELVTQSISFKSGKIASAEYYNYLKNLALQSGIDLTKRFPNLANYTIYNSIYSRIENDKLFADIKKAEDAIKEKLFKNDDQRTLEKLSRHIEILLGLINIKLLNGDFEYYKSHKDEFAVEAFCDFLKKKAIQYGLAYDVDLPSDSVAGNTQKLEEFYTIAIKRDEALVDNTLNAMKKNKQDIAVLITGGFHSEGISKLLEKQGISYMVVCPSITKDVPTPYIQILTNQRTPLENILIGTAEAKEAKSGMLAPYLISAARQLKISKKDLASLKDIGAFQGRLDIAAQFDGIFAGRYIERWIDKAKIVARSKGLPYDKEILHQAFNMAVDNAARRDNVSDEDRNEIKALAKTIFARIDIDREKVAARSLMEERAKSAARVAEKVSYERSGAAATARVSAAGADTETLTELVAGKTLEEAIQLCKSEYEKVLHTVPEAPKNDDNETIRNTYKQAFMATKKIAAYKQGLEIARDILSWNASAPSSIHQITKGIFAKMAEGGLPKLDTMPDAALVAIRMEAAEGFLLRTLAVDEAKRSKIFDYFTSLINQYIAFTKLTMKDSVIDPADRTSLDKRINAALNFTRPIQAERERSELKAALDKLYGSETVAKVLTETNNNIDEAISILLLDNKPGMLRNWVEKTIKIDLIASQRLGMDDQSMSKERELALRFMKAVCMKMAGLNRSLANYKTEAEFGQVFNEHFGVLFVVLAGGSGSRYGLVTHKSHGATFTGMDNVDLTLRGAFHTPLKPAESQDMHYLISSLFSMLKCLNEQMRLGLMERAPTFVKEEADLWPKEIGMRKVEPEETDRARIDRFLPSGTYYLRQESGEGGYGGSFMEDIKFMVEQQNKGKLPNVPYFMRLDGEQATVQEEGVANVTLITWMTAVADNNLVTLGLREDKVIEGKGMPIDEPLLGVVRFLQDWRNIPPDIKKSKLLALLKDNKEMPANAELREKVERWLKLSPEEQGLLVEQIHGDTAIEQRNPVYINANIVVMHKNVVTEKYFDKVWENEQLKGQVNDRTNTLEFAPADVSVCVFDDYAINKPGERIPLGYSVVSKGPSAIKNTFKQNEFNIYWQNGIREMLNKAGVDISELLVLTINPGSDEPIFNLKKAEDMLFGKNGVFFEAIGGKVEGVKLIGKVHIDLRAKIGNRVTIKNSYIRESTKVGTNCTLDGTTLINIKIGDRSTLINCYLEDGRELISAGSTLGNEVRNIPSHSRAPEWDALDKIYERSSSSGTTVPEELSEVLAGATFSSVESVLLSQDMNGEDTLRFIKELREQELGETDHEMERAIATGNGNDLNYVAREIIKNMGLFTLPISMDPSLEGQPLTFPIATERLPIYFNIPGMNKMNFRLLYQIVSMFGKMERDEKKGKIRRIDAVHIMGRLMIANEFTRFGSGVSIDGLETHGRLYAGDGWGIVNTKIPNLQSVVVLGDHVMILDEDGDVVSYEPPLDGDINSLSLVNGCDISAKRVYIGPGAGTQMTQYRGKVLQNVTIKGGAVVIPEGTEIKAGKDIDERINDFERSLALTFAHKNRDEAYVIMKEILRGENHDLLGEYGIGKIGRLTSIAAVICFMVNQGNSGRANDLLDKLMKDEPVYYSQLINKVYVISQIIDPDRVFKDWLVKSGKSPVPPPPARLKSYSDIKNDARSDLHFGELFTTVEECSRLGIEPLLMTTERREVDVQGVKRRQRGFASEMTKLSTYKDPVTLGEVILRHSVVKDPEDLTLLLRGYLAYEKMIRVDNDSLRQAYRVKLSKIEAEMRAKWMMDINDDAVVAFYVALFGPQSYIGLPTARPFEFSCFRGGRGAHWFLNEIKDQLRSMGVKSYRMHMLPGATDDGRSWLLCSLIYEAPGMPDIGKCLMDIAQDRVLADIIGSDNSRFNSIDQLYAFNRTYKAMKEGLTEEQRKKMGADNSFARRLYDYGYGKNSTVKMKDAADAINEYVKLFCETLQGPIRQHMPALETQNIIIHTLEELREALLNQKEEYPEVNWKNFVDKIWEYLTVPDEVLGEKARRYIDSVAGVQGEIERILGKRDEYGKVLVPGCLMQDLKEPGERRQEILEDKLLDALKAMARKDNQALREFLYTEFCANMTIPKFGMPIRSAALVGAHIHFEEVLNHVPDTQLPQMAQLKATRSDIAWQRAIDSLSDFLDVQGSSVAPVTLRRYHLSGVAAGEVDKDTGNRRLQLLLSEDSYNEIPKEGEFLFTTLMRRPVLDPGVKKRLRAAAKDGDLESVIAIFKKASDDASIARGEVPDIILNPKAIDAIEKTKLLFLFPTTLMSNIGPAILDKRIGEAVAGNDQALKVYIHNAQKENDPPHTTAATMLENLFRILSDQQRYNHPHAVWEDVNKYFSYVIARNPCRYVAFSDTYIAPDADGIRALTEGNVSTVELDVEDPKSSSKGRYLGPPLMRAVLQLEQLKNLGVRVMDGHITPFTGMVSPEGRIISDAIELQSEVAGAWGTRVSASGAMNKNVMSPEAMQMLTKTMQLTEIGENYTAVSDLFKSNLKAQEKRDICVQVINHKLDVNKADPQMYSVVRLQNFVDLARREAQRMPFEDSVYARDISLVIGQTDDIISWINRGVYGAVDMRLTVNDSEMVISDKGKSFLKIDTIPVAVSPKEGTAGFYHRGVEGIGNVQGLKNKMGDINVSQIAMKNMETFNAERNNSWIYLMGHGWTQVPSALIQMTENKGISTIHETSFLMDTVPGAMQCISTGPGHFQKGALDFKYVTEGEGIQYNKFYDESGKLVAVYAQYLKPGSWAVALPFAVDSVENLGGLRFNDISVEVANPARWAQESFPELGKLGVNFSKLASEDAAKLVTNAINVTPVPYYAVKISGENRLVKNDDKAPAIRWTNSVDLGKEISISRAIATIPLTTLYSQYLTPESIHVMIGEVRSNVLSRSWATKAPSIKEATAEEVTSARQSATGAKELAESGRPIVMDAARPNIRIGQDGFTWGKKAKVSDKLSNILAYLGIELKDVWNYKKKEYGISEDEPVAEYHPVSDDSKYPSYILVPGSPEPVSLRAFLDQYGVQVLGKEHADEYGNYLACIMKLLDVDESASISIAVHPMEGYKPGKYVIRGITYEDKTPRPMKPEMWEFYNSASFLFGFDKSKPSVTPEELVEAVPQPDKETQDVLDKMNDGKAKELGDIEVAKAEKLGDIEKVAKVKELRDINVAKAKKLKDFVIDNLAKLHKIRKGLKEQGLEDNEIDKLIPFLRAKGSLPELLNKVKAEKSDLYEVPGAVIHALGSGCFLAEWSSASFAREGEKSLNLTAAAVAIYDRAGPDGSYARPNKEAPLETIAVMLDAQENHKVKVFEPLNPNEYKRNPAVPIYADSLKNAATRLFETPVTVVEEVHVAPGSGNEFIMRDLRGENGLAYPIFLKEGAVTISGIDRKGEPFAQELSSEPGKPRACLIQAGIGPVTMTSSEGAVLQRFFAPQSDQKVAIGRLNSRLAMETTSFKSRVPATYRALYNNPARVSASGAVETLAQVQPAVVNSLALENLTARRYAAELPNNETRQVFDNRTAGTFEPLSGADIRGYVIKGKIGATPEGKLFWFQEPKIITAEEEALADTIVQKADAIQRAINIVSASSPQKGAAEYRIYKDEATTEYEMIQRTEAIDSAKRGFIGATSDGKLVSLVRPELTPEARNAIRVRDRTSSTGAVKEGMTAAEILKQSTEPDIEALKGLLQAMNVSGILGDSIVVVGYDTGMEPRVHTGPVAQAGERGVNKIKYLNGSLINIRGSGFDLADEMENTVKALQADPKNKGKTIKVVTISSDATLKDIGAKTLAGTGQSVSALDEKAIMNAGAQRLRGMAENAKVLSIDNRDGRYIPVIGLYELAIRMAYLSATPSSDDMKFILSCLNRIALNANIDPRNPTPFTMNDMQGLLSTGMIRILPRIVPMTMDEAVKAYNAAQKVLVAL